MKPQIAVTLAALILSVSTSFADDEIKASKEDRQKMAAMHTKMAACLESDKSMSDCRKEMMTSCKDMMGKSGCPMMGMGHMKGMMKDHSMMMDNGEENKSDKKNKK